MRRGGGGKRMMMPMMMVCAILMMAAFFCLGPFTDRGGGDFGSPLFFVLCCLCLLGLVALAGLVGFILLQTDTGHELLQNLPDGIQGLFGDAPKKKRETEEDFEEV